MPVKRGKAKPKAAAQVPKPSSARLGLSKGKAWGALVLNLLIPGLGSWIGKRREWPAQIIITIISIPLILILVGYLTLFAVWVWALISSIRMIEEAR